MPRSIGQKSEAMSSDLRNTFDPHATRIGGPGGRITGRVSTLAVQGEDGRKEIKGQMEIMQSGDCIGWGQRRVRRRKSKKKLRHTDRASLMQNESGSPFPFDNPTATEIALLQAQYPLPYVPYSAQSSSKANGSNAISARRPACLFGNRKTLLQKMCVCRGRARSDGFTV